MSETKKYLFVLSWYIEGPENLLKIISTWQTFELFTETTETQVAHWWLFKQSIDLWSRHLDRSLLYYPTKSNILKILGGFSERQIQRWLFSLVRRLNAKRGFGRSPWVRKDASVLGLWNAVSCAPDYLARKWSLSSRNRHNRRRQVDRHCRLLHCSKLWNLARKTQESESSSIFQGRHSKFSRKNRPYFKRELFNSYILIRHISM